ncbi:N-formylglutamate deformylase [Sphingomonas sp. AX6]|uniref:N-formylglutamate deformylase n=1 Tax=Sphingomonas sp. AX6 TaxID=2653171 RepID=UPI0012F41D24|nr:N-formylglutamate deformylase [Sphingomonas sp. AX6]VXC87078.1 N-formylglutamate deformylase [Sphingomonas sp. AX6]
MNDWLHVRRGDAPLIVSVPHAGTTIPDDLVPHLRSSWLAKRDADWWVDRLYDFAGQMGATTIRTDISRTVIDMNRDPSGASLYPGQATTGLCPTETFDDDPLWLEGHVPDAAEIDRRRITYFDPYHAAIRAEIDRLSREHPTVVLYDAHSIRSIVPRLFDGELPVFNIGTDGGRTCAVALASAVEQLCTATGLPTTSNGRFRGGWITRHYGAPEQGVHAIQMELAMRGYLREPAGASTPENWPVAYDPDIAKPMRGHLRGVLEACLDFASSTPVGVE